MKFFTFFAVAALAMSVSAYNVRRDIHTITNINNNKIIRSSDAASFPEAFNVAVGHFVEGFKQLFPEPFANFIDQYYRAFQKSFEYIPADLKTAFANVFKHIPSYKEFFPAEFFAACAEFFRTFNDFFVPRQFAAFFENFFENLPNFYEVFPEQFWSTIRTHLEHAPFAREFLRNVYMVFKQLASHAQ